MAVIPRLCEMCATQPPELYGWHSAVVFSKCGQYCSELAMGRTLDSAHGVESVLDEVRYGLPGETHIPPQAQSQWHRGLDLQRVSGDDCFVERGTGADSTRECPCLRSGSSLDRKSTRLNSS